MAKTTKNRKAQKAEVTKVQFDKALGDYSTNLQTLTDITSARDVKIKAIMDEYAGQIGNLQSVQGAQFETLKNFCLQNKDTLFSEKKRSMKTALLILGLRKDTPSVVLKSGKRWEDVIKLMKEKLPGFIRTKEEPNKDEILAKRSEIGLQLNECGITIKQEEKFFITPIGKEETPIVTLAPEAVEEVK